MSICERRYNSMKEVVRNFPPSWFACTMGTGILSNVSYMYSAMLPKLKEVSVILFWLNFFVFFVLLTMWLMRWIVFSKEAMKDLKDPVAGNFYPTIGVGMLVIAAGALLVIKNSFIAWIFWSFGTALTLVFSILIPMIYFTSENVQIHHLNPAWFIPPVGLIVIPIAGSNLLTKTSGMLHDFLETLNIFSWGAGFFLYIALHAVMMYRFVLHKPLPSSLSPTVWINLGPVGAGILSLVGIVKNSFPELLKGISVFSAFLWGIGFWWLIIAVVMTIIYILRRELKFALSWWAFTFPLGAFVASCHILSNLLSLKVIDYIGFALYIFLFIIWIITFTRSFITKIALPIFKSF